MIAEDGDIELNVGAEPVTLVVTNTGDRPVQVGSHVHFPRPTVRSASTGPPPMAAGSTFPPAPRCDSNRASR